MKYDNKCDIFLKLVDKTDFFWNFFYISSVVIFVSLLHEDLKSYNVFIKITASFFYIAFNKFTACALIRCYFFLGAMAEEIKINSEKEFVTPQINNLLKRLKYKRRVLSVCITYTLVTIINILILWFH